MDIFHYYRQFSSMHLTYLHKKTVENAKFIFHSKNLTKFYINC
jgi:hypothetical protein